MRIHLVTLGSVILALAACSSSSTSGGASTSAGESGSGKGSSSESGATSQAHSSGSGAATPSGSGTQTGSQTELGSGSVTNFTVATQVAVIGPAGSSTVCTGSADGGSGMCSSTGGSGQALVIYLANRSNITCSVLKSAQGTGKQFNFSNLEAFEIEVANSTGPLAVGTFPIVSPNAMNVTSGALAEYESTNGTCDQTAQVAAVSGSVDLTTFSTSMVAGTYTINFGSGSPITGSFSTSVCEVEDGGSHGSDSDASICE